MTTDTIPEACEVAYDVQFAKYEIGNLTKRVSQACLAYHKRRLAECGGDARELADKLWNILDPIDNAEVGDLDKATELLQLHTAKAVEEAIQKLTPEQVHNICHNLEKTVSPEEFAKGCEDYQKKLFGFCPTTDTITTLQKQCEELRRAITAQDAERNEMVKDFIALEKERDDLRTKLVEQKELNAFVAKGSFEASQVMAKENAHLRERAEKAEHELKQWEELGPLDIEAISKLSKAEAEVAELSKQFGTCSICGKVAWRTDKNDATLEHCQFCELNNQLTQLQQDVRPLVALLSDTKSIANTTGFLVVGAHIKEALETFLAKHPECKH